MHVTQLNLEYLKISNLRPAGVFKRFTQIHELYALHVIRFCFDHYLDDIKKCVKEGVDQDLKNSTERGRSERKKALARWLKGVGARSFNFKSSEIKDLLIAVCGYNPDALGHGLPPTNNVRLSAHQLATAIFAGTSPIQSNTLRAPFFRNGTFQVVLRSALRSLFDLNSERLGAKVSDWLVLQIRRVLEAFEYKVVPWNAEACGGDGNGNNNRQRLAAWNRWALINVTSKDLASDRELSTSHIEDAVQNALSKAIHLQLQSDPTLPWTLGEVEISELPRILKRGTLPKWELPFREATDRDGPNGYVYETYEWARDRFDANDPAHYVALTLAVLLGKLCPYLNHDKEICAKLFSEKTSVMEARTLASELTWEPNPKLSYRDAGKVACAFITTALALTDPQSPLLKRMRKGTGSLGKEWNNKNRECRLLLVPSPLIVRSSFFCSFSND